MPEVASSFFNFSQVGDASCIIRSRAPQLVESCPHTPLDFEVFCQHAPNNFFEHVARRARVQHTRRRPWTRTPVGEPPMLPETDRRRPKRCMRI